MMIMLSPEVAAKAREKAAAEGVSVEGYLEKLVCNDDWTENSAEVLDETDPEFLETRREIMEALEQVERGEGVPAREFFAELRAKHGVSD